MNTEDDPSHRNSLVPEADKTREISHTHENGQAESENSGLMSWIKTTLKGKPDASLRETIEEYIEEQNGEGLNGQDNTVSVHEKTLISNVLKLKDTTVVDVMIPRADIVAIDISTPAKKLMELLSKEQYSRIPVYKEKLDEVLGTIHIKDILATLAKGGEVSVEKLVRDVPIISPSMSLPDLMLQMRQQRKQMAMVVDEFGGIDGLVTIGDILEAIVGQIDDEHDKDEQPQLVTSSDGSIMADARFELDEFENQFGALLDEEEREDSDTLGGLVFHIAGRVPARGEVLLHKSGMVFEVLEADPRRVSKVKITKIPQNVAEAE